MSLVIWGTATVSAMPSTTRTSELRHSTMRIHQRRELRVSIGLPSRSRALRTLFLRCAHCTHRRTVCASSLVMYANANGVRREERHGGQGETDSVGMGTA